MCVSCGMRAILVQQIVASCWRLDLRIRKIRMSNSTFFYLVKSHWEKRNNGRHLFPEDSRLQVPNCWPMNEICWMFTVHNVERCLLKHKWMHSYTPVFVRHCVSYWNPDTFEINKIVCSIKLVLVSCSCYLTICAHVSPCGISLIVPTN